MDYLGYFGLQNEPFSNAPLARFYFESKQHTDALGRLRYAASSMKGLALLVGDIGHGKTTLARRMLDSLPESEFEAAMLVIVHAGITPNWLLKRIATQLGVANVADDKLTILSQLYQRLLQIYQAGKKAVVLIDEAQMLASRELMEEFRGLLNLEVPERKLLSFVFFGLPDIERNLLLDPPLAQRVALRCHLKPLSADDTTAYINHRLRLAGSERPIFTPPTIQEVFRLTSGVPRLINTLCDNILLEMFFSGNKAPTVEIVSKVAQSLRIGDTTLRPPELSAPAYDVPATEGSPGFDAVVSVGRDAPDMTGQSEADAIAARVAHESGAHESDIQDPLAYMQTPKVDEDELPPVPPIETYAEFDVDVDESFDHQPTPQAIRQGTMVLGSIFGSSAAPKTRAEANLPDGPIVEKNTPPVVTVSRDVPPVPTEKTSPVSETGLTAASKTPVPSSKAVTTSTGRSIDLSEIDALLADLNLDKKK